MLAMSAEHAGGAACEDSRFAQMSLESGEIAVETDPRIRCRWTGAVGPRVGGPQGWVQMERRGSRKEP